MDQDLRHFAEYHCGVTGRCFVSVLFGTSLTISIVNLRLLLSWTIAQKLITVSKTNIASTGIVIGIGFYGGDFNFDPSDSDVSVATA